MKKLSWMIVAICMAFPVFACDKAKQNDMMVVTDVWTRPKTEIGTATGVFLILKNQTAMDEQLISAATPIAERVELHDHIMENDQMKMREVAMIEIKADCETKLQPGGLHVMLFGVKQALNPGDHFPLTLNFKNGQPIQVEVEVKEMGYMPKKECHCHD